MTKLSRNGALLAVAAVAILLFGAFVCAGFDLMPDNAQASLDIGSAILANPVLLVGLRAKHADLTTRATAKLAEIKDGLAPEVMTRIEGEHAALVTELATVSRSITDMERAEPPAPDVVVVERTRSADITRLATRHAMPADFASQHIAAGSTVEAVRTLVLDHVAAEAARTRISPRAEIVTDEGDTLREAVENAIENRATSGRVKLTDAGREFRGMTLIEVGKEFHARAHNVKLRGFGNEVAPVLLGLERRGGMLSTSDFPNILANVVSKRLRDAYQTAPQTWKVLSRQSNAPDFKQKSVVQLSNLPKFKQVKEGGEYQYAALSDGAAKYALATYGRIVPITRQTLINDDLGAFDRMPMLLGRAAAETEASIFWALWTANSGAGVAMEDGLNVFDATGHGNYTASGTDISVVALDVGRTALRTQKGFGADAEPLNLSPKYIVVSPAKETKAQMFLASITATKGGDINPFANSLQQITEARLSGNGWYLSADPGQIDTIEYAYLEGEEGLYTETRFGFEVDGIEVKGRLDYAAHWIDYRGVYFNAGA